VETIKQKGLLNPQMYKIFTAFNSQNSNLLINKISLGKTNFGFPNFRYSNLSKNDKFRKENIKDV
jgi:hypothetical protein